MQIDPEHIALFDEARRYDEAGDTYNAVKLYKRLTKLSADWAEPYFHLSLIYKRRHEWKQVFHYSKRTVSLAPANQEAWWNLGIAAVGLKKTRLARSIWTKFGWDSKQKPRHPYGLQLTYEDAYEILWMQPLDPARAQILSIPHPASGLRFREEVLYDRKPVGYHVVSKRRIPVYASLGSVKRSPFQTFSCLVHVAPDSAAVKQLELLCANAGIGFEVWSNAARIFTPEHRRAFPEYYSDLVPRESTDQCLVALAALHEAEVQRVLNNWQIITFAQYSDVRGY